MSLVAIARNACVESLRQPVFVVLLLGGILALVLNVNLAAFTLDSDDKLLVDLGLSTLFLTGLLPGEVFVHRNVANLAPPQDANYLSVLQFAVDVLKVRHVMVVGHYGCGGVAAAVDGRRRGLVDHWLHPIREIYAEHRGELEVLEDGPRLDRLCELNVIRQVRNVASDVFVQEAWARGQAVSVHGWIYAIHDGLLTDLGVTVSDAAGLETLQPVVRPA